MMLRVCTLLLLGAAALGAQQTVQGRVTDRTSGFPVGGVVVAALDTSGNTIARTVTDSASGYRMPILAGMSRLSFRRIGYSPSNVALRDSVNGRLDVVLDRLPTQLPPVKATVVAQCDEKANTPDVLALWDQARTGLMTSLVARESKAGYTSVFVYQTNFDGDDEQPRAVERVELPPGTAVPFISGGEPETLAKTGYTIPDAFNQMTFLGPDDRVLLDESFLATHCFTLEKAPGDSLVGIRFETGKGSKVVDVEGTLWLRRDPLDLASVEYTYTNLDRTMQRVRPGGSIHFRQMPNGITMVHRWRIRGATVMAMLRPGPRGAVMVGMGGRGRGQIGLPRGTPTRVTGGAVASATETGAIIELMQWPEVAPYVAPLATVSGVLMDKHLKRPLANTPVRFYRTPFETTTDSTGAFKFIDVLPGVYEMEAGDYELEKYGAAGDLAGPVTIKYGANRIDVEGEGPAAAIARACDEKSDGRVDMPKALAGRNAVFGRITMPTGMTPAKREFRVEVLPAGLTAGSPGFPLKGKTDQAGQFRLCDLPAGTVRIVSTDRSGGGTGEVQLEAGPEYKLVTIKVERRP